MESIANRLREETEKAQHENDLPDYLAERILSIADLVHDSSTDIELLLEQLPLYDTYGQTGYLGMGVNHLILEKTIERIEQSLPSASAPAYVPALGVHWLTPFYDLVAATFSRERSFKPVLIDQAAVEPEHRVLDLGAGTGTLAIWLKQHHPEAEIACLDIDADMLAKAAKKAGAAGTAIDFEQGSAFSLPYPPAHFHRIVSSLFFHHLTWEEKIKTAREMFRVLKPGGEIHIADWGRAANPLMRSVFYIVQIVDGFAVTRDNVAGRLITLYEEAGFIDVTERRTYSTLFGTLALYSAKKPDESNLD